MDNEVKLLSILGQMQSQMDKMSVDMSGLKNDVSDLKNDVSGLKNDVSDLKNDVSGLKNDVSGLKNDVSDLKNDVSELQRNMDAVKASVLKTELEQYPRIQAALDGMTSVLEHNTVQDGRLRMAEIKIEKHGFEIEKLKQAVL